MLLLLTLPADTTRHSLCYERWFGRSKVNLHIRSEFLSISTRTSTVYSKPSLNTINPLPNTWPKWFSRRCSDFSSVLPKVIIGKVLELLLGPSWSGLGEGARPSPWVSLKWSTGMSYCLLGAILMRWGTHRNLDVDQNSTTIDALPLSPSLSHREKRRGTD